jgi:hypothetical protein
MQDALWSLSMALLCRIRLVAGHDGLIVPVSEVRTN